MAPVSQVSDANALKTLLSSGNLSIVHFAAEWAPQCQQITDVLNDLGSLPDVAAGGPQFIECPAENLPEISQQYMVEAVPTVLFIRNSKLVDRIDGADIAKLTAKVKEHTVGKESTINGDVPLEVRLKNLINRHKVMIFMKGNRDGPKCGFSKTLIQIVNDIGVEYETFDILTDEAVRQGLKTYSDWPTYPQVYVNGDLIGGLDIIKEMLAAGDLESTLKG